VDVLEGLAGDDVLSDADVDGGSPGMRPGRDELVGGPGFDTVSYAGRRRPVTVDLARPAGNGARREDDVLRGFEAAIGGAGDDRLASARNARPAENSLYAGRLEGGAGADLLIGRGGPDHLLPGGGADQIGCGGRRDAVDGGIAARDFLATDCEQVQVGDLQFNADAKVTRSAFAYRVTCTEDGDQADSCSGTLRVAEAAPPRRLLARGRFSGSDFRFPARAALTPLGAALTARPGGVMASVQFRGRGLLPAAWRTRLSLDRR
jgi:hypothetical protein